MLRIETFTFNPFQENTYLLINDDNACWIIDPGMHNAEEESALFDYIAANNLLPQQIINTHTHIDHVFGVDALKTKYKIPFGIHKSDLPVLQNASGSAMLFGIPFGSTPQADFFIEDDSPLNIGKDILTVRFTPGHSPGSISFYNKENSFVIAGDVLFQGSIGRTDLPGGHHQTLINTIHTELYTLPDDTIVYPGHGLPTTIGMEKKTNPFVQG